MDYAQGHKPYENAPSKTSRKRWYLSTGPTLIYKGGRNLSNLATREEKQNRYRYGFNLANLQKAIELC